VVIPAASVDKKREQSMDSYRPLFAMVLWFFHSHPSTRYTIDCQSREKMIGLRSKKQKTKKKTRSWVTFGQTNHHTTLVSFFQFCESMIHFPRRKRTKQTLPYINVKTIIVLLLFYFTASSSLLTLQLLPCFCGRICWIPFILVRLIFQSTFFSFSRLLQYSPA